MKRNPVSNEFSALTLLDYAGRRYEMGHRYNLEAATAKFHLQGRFAGFAVNSRIPLLFQFFETAARVVAKAVLYAQFELCGEKTCVVFVKLGLVKLLEAAEHALERFGGVNEDRPLAVTEDELVDGLAAMNLPLTGSQASEETFEIVVSPPAFRPSIAGKEARPPLTERRTKVGHRLGIFGARLGLLFQLGQELFDVSLDVSPRRAWLVGSLWRIQSPIQFDQPTVLPFEAAILDGEGVAALNHGEELIQNGMTPFLRLRRREASKRVRSSNTRRPPSANGGLLPSVSVVRIRSA